MGKFRDIADMAEDERIECIGRHVMALADGKTGAFVVDSQPPEKVERYIKKLKERWPEVVVLRRLPGPMKGMISVVLTKKIKPSA